MRRERNHRHNGQQRPHHYDDRHRCVVIMAISYGCSVDDRDDGNIEYNDEDDGDDGDDDGDDDEEEAPATRWSGVDGLGWDGMGCCHNGADANGFNMRLSCDRRQNITSITADRRARDDDDGDDGECDAYDCRCDWGPAWLLEQRAI
ncbi:hypothetical protein AWZ03_010625 [Drosophila navojoa]|uniref:Uncharacterized protein n=1 Tax=Drosophila navojoa TaxID=7232 RepID=A0A484B2C1_DRONA|nr:hypothetical protein AWZ03_010625 [Drosophila navojoa]